MAAPANDPSIQTSCPHCGKRYRLKSSIVGRKAKCGGCQQTFTIAVTQPSDDDLYKIEDDPVPVPISSPPVPAAHAIEVAAQPAPVQASPQKTSSLIEELPAKLEAALKELLRPDEPVYLKLKGAFKEGLISTDTRVILLKSGFMTGQTFGSNTFQIPYSNVSGVEVKFHLLTGYFELSAGGMQNMPKNYWSNTDASNPSKAPNCISLNSRDQAARFREACSFILDKVTAARTVLLQSELERAAV